jgi:Nuclease-related domain
MAIVEGTTLNPLREGDPSKRVAGQHARATVLRLRLRTLVALGVLAVVTTVLGRSFGLQSALFVGSELALLACMFLVLRYVVPLLERRDRGAAGEEHVGGLLDSLAGRSWGVIHDASFGHGNIDHIVCGPAGLFTIETKSHPGPIKVRAIHGGLLRQAQEERETIERVTGERVEPLLVFSRAWVDKPLARRRGVRVLPARMLLSYLDGHPQRLSPERARAARALIIAALAR